MNESIRDILAREAEEAESVAEEEEPTGQRARAQAGDPSQVYSVRIPVDRLDQLRRLAEDRGIRPTALLRQFVLDRLDAETAPVEVITMPGRDRNEIRLGPSRSAPTAGVVSLTERRA